MIELSFPIRETYKFGYKNGDPTFYNSLHRGVDIIVKEGTPIFAPMDGMITKKNIAVEEGNELKILKLFPDNLKVESYMCHLKEYAPQISAGIMVTEGDLIGYVGSSGKRSTGSHLHWHLYLNGKVADPLLYIRKTMEQKKEEFVKEFDTKLILVKETQKFYRLYNRQLQEMVSMAMILHYLHRRDGGAVIDSKKFSELQ